MEIKEVYKIQVALLLQVLPEVAKEADFALHGGTAINLFVREMPRLSVDLDITYMPIEDRATSLSKIIEGLKRIKANIESIVPRVNITLDEKILKLLISTPTAQIKLEVNQANRGVLETPMEMMLCQRAQDEFNAFAAITVVSLPQLYGGKICAALDRQHPRDLFDIKLLMEHEGFTEEMKKDFILCLLSSNRPLYEILNPNLTDQRHAMENHFDGMSAVPFSYEEFEKIRVNLIRIVNENLNEEDKTFLMSFIGLEPNWEIYDFEKFPAVKWKLENLKKLKEANPGKYQDLIENLKKVLY